ncbi:ATP-dependent DNA helicase [Canibacter zhoujuaniae]|uniref:ATP-dependent DNA helicase n=1 Tax=Canibacter zhoujuaniae TaxID=2708343 RepID=UPI00141DEC86|nr:ATP-dependent DNA helicase [Canibacter zhoujuaniae]
MTDKYQVFSAFEIARALGNFTNYFRPTEEQTAIIEHPVSSEHGRQVLVLAGAGSGKTATLAQRVVWLIANGHARPSEILGLTFTNKATNELRARITKNVLEFFDAVLNPVNFAHFTQEQIAHAESLQQAVSFDIERPEISSYNAFASRIVHEYGHYTGRKVAAIIDEPIALNLAQQVLAEGSREELLALEGLRSDLPQILLRLENEIVDNGFIRWSDDRLKFRQALETAVSDGFSTVARNETARQLFVRNLIKQLDKTDALLPFVARLRKLKQEKGMMQFSDQVAQAIDILVQPDSIARAELRDSFKFVLLDEVQDTSAGQTQMLQHLFAGKNIMAVGDPHQSIYGWRGASASALTKFGEHFAEDPGSFEVLNLSISWRNAAPILEVANHTVSPLRKELEVRGASLKGADIRVQPLRHPDEALAERSANRLAAESEPETNTAGVTVGLFAHDSDEVEFIADEILRIRSTASADKQKTIAVITRNRGVMPTVEQALTRRGIKSEIVGGGGLLSTPEITEIQAVLRCLGDADAGESLVRVLTGPRFEVPLTDIRALSVYARKLTKANRENSSLAQAEGSEALKYSVDDIVSNISALYELPVKRPAGCDFSNHGYARLQEAQAVFQRLHGYVNSDITTLIEQIVREMRLWVELAAHPKNREHTGALKPHTHGNIYAFTEYLLGYQSATGDTSITGLLRWLRASQAEDRESQAEIKPSLDTVQIITGHAAKGLEWDVVFAPFQYQSAFPGQVTPKLGWMTEGRLDYASRLDSDDLPQIDVNGTPSEVLQKSDLPGERLRKQLDRRVDSYSLREALEKLLKSFPADEAQVSEKDIKKLDAERAKHFRWRKPPYVSDVFLRHINDERRIAYVMYTRAKETLYITSSYFRGNGKRAEKPSVFLTEALHIVENHLDHNSSSQTPVSVAAIKLVNASRVRESGVPCAACAAYDSRGFASHAEFQLSDDALPEYADTSDIEVPKENPKAETVRQFISWPHDALGERRQQVEASAAAVREQLTRFDTGDTAGIVGAEVLSDWQKLLLLERETHQLKQPTRPEYLNTSEVADFLDDPQKLLRNKLRPIPARPFSATVLGTQFHEWVERRLTSAGASAQKLALFETVPDPHPGATLAESRELNELIQKFEASRFTSLKALEVEQDYAASVAGVPLQAKIDAVFLISEEPERYEIVDWKTGKAPVTDSEKARSLTQVEIYRELFAAHNALNLEQVRATLFYVREGIEISTASAPSGRQLHRLTKALGKLDEVMN